MISATDTITIHLTHSVSGMLAEVTGLPMPSGPEYVAKLRLRELAERALHERYPLLKIRSAWSSGDTSYIFQVENL